ncbi:MULTISPECIES: hypothetical protein [Leptotrichia]|uniref:hypothetical protein n=1 Tax=Leptotrichia TaxID=32067 RepID=UPI0003AE3E48|nr:MULTISPECIES: hypothetical protein [Leptotrichia]ERL25069.1 hypothetical protein HMPREF9108_01930 [Leptotrichia sp. oral taxon 225 str. F0581]WLD75422.1 hypothetical protein QU666_05995 [Leptotrichia sp. HMT-225]
MFKKILLMVILTMSVVGCELLSPSYWNDVNQSRREEGRKCYRRASGTFYCKDKYGNRVY